MEVMHAGRRRQGRGIGSVGSASVGSGGAVVVDGAVVGDGTVVVDGGLDGSCVGGRGDAAAESRACGAVEGVGRGADGTAAALTAGVAPRRPGDSGVPVAGSRGCGATVRAAAVGGAPGRCTGKPASRGAAVAV